MMERVTNAIFGGMFLAMSGYMLRLHLTSEEPLQALILLLGGVLLLGAVACLRAGLAAKTDSRANMPPPPTDGETAAQRLLALKKRPVPNFAGYRP
jgi:hypothetical protein